MMMACMGQRTERISERRKFQHRKERPTKIGVRISDSESSFVMECSHSNTHVPSCRSFIILVAFCDDEGVREDEEEASKQLGQPAQSKSSAWRLSRIAITLLDYYSRLSSMSIQCLLFLLASNRFYSCCRRLVWRPVIAYHDDLLRLIGHHERSREADLGHGSLLR